MEYKSAGLPHLRIFGQAGHNGSYHIAQIRKNKPAVLCPNQWDIAMHQLSYQTVYWIFYNHDA
jgi:hypothetical protein